MALASLKKIFYTDRHNHYNAYLQRFHSPSSVLLDFYIQQFNHNNSFQAFFYYSPELVSLIENIYISHRSLTDIIHNFPPIALHQFALASIVDEVHSTSAIEGIHSTHWELRSILEGNYSSSHFSSTSKNITCCLMSVLYPFTLLMTLGLSMMTSPMMKLRQTILITGLTGLFSGRRLLMLNLLQAKYCIGALLQKARL